MIIRVPLVLQPSVAVIHRLDVKATRQHDPAGDDASGYDEVLREPITYNDASGNRVDSRRELAEIRVPCQVEVLSDEKLREMVTGDDSVSNMIFVFHRLHLEQAGLLDSNRNVVLKKGDRISQIERFGAPTGTVTKKLEPPGLYVWEMRSASWGFGPDGHDLELAIMQKRREGFST